MRKRSFSNRMSFVISLSNFQILNEDYMKKLKNSDNFYIVLHIFEVKTDEEFN